MKPKNVEGWLNIAHERLKIAGVKSGKLDAELILARVLKIKRTQLHAHPFRKLSKQQIFHANNWLKKREKRIPLAYIFGQKEFFGRNFKVNSSVLVPRSETENLIELYQKIACPDDFILEVGTGSGIIAITAKLENPLAQVVASDISKEALSVAYENSKKLGTKVEFFESDLLEQIPEEILESTTVLVANLPYVNRDWIDFKAQNELHHEPQIALYAEDKGLTLIKKLIYQTSNLPQIKYLILEADPEQFEEIEKLANTQNFTQKEVQDYAILFEKS